MRYFLPMLLAACVGKGKHELVQVQLDATRTALSARQLACAESAAALEAQLRAATDARDDADHQRATREEELTSLRSELEALRAAQATWIVAVTPNDPTSPDPEAIPAPLPDDVLALLTAGSAAKRGAALRDGAHAEVVAVFAPLAPRVEVVASPEGSVVRIGAHTLFQEGRVVLSPLGESVLEGVAAALSTLEGRTLRIDGHTDDRPVHSVEQPSNWELGFDRAVLVLRALQEFGLSVPVTIASRADTAPIADPTTPEGDKRNARIELVLVSAHAP